MESVALASTISVVVTTLFWLVLAIVIGVTVRGAGQVLGIIGCIIPLLTVVVSQIVFTFVAPTLGSQLWTGAIVILQVVQLLLGVVGITLLCAAVIAASRGRARVAGGLR